MAFIISSSTSAAWYDAGEIIIEQANIKHLHIAGIGFIFRHHKRHFQALKAEGVVAFTTGKPGTVIGQQAAGNINGNNGLVKALICSTSSAPSNPPAGG